VVFAVGGIAVIRLAVILAILTTLTAHAWTQEMMMRKAYGARGASVTYSMPSTNSLVLHLDMSGNGTTDGSAHTAIYDVSQTGYSYSRVTAGAYAYSNTVNGKITKTIKTLWGPIGTGTVFDKDPNAYANKVATMAFWINIVSNHANGAGMQNKDTVECYDNQTRGVQIDGSTKKIQYSYLVSGSGYSWQSQTSLSTGVWYHICYVSDASGSILYINGELDSSTNISWYSNNYGTQRHRIGCANNSGQTFDGYLDDFRIYTNQLTANEVMGLYLNSPTGN
jgi:hypothetical protein